MQTTQQSSNSKVSNIHSGKPKKKLSKAQQEALEREREDKHSHRHELFCDVIARLEALDLNEVAEQADVHHSTLYNWVHGDVTSPLFNNLAKVSKAIGMILQFADAPAKKSGSRRIVAH